MAFVYSCDVINVKELPHAKRIFSCLYEIFNDPCARGNELSGDHIVIKRYFDGRSQLAFGSVEVFLLKNPIAISDKLRLILHEKEDGSDSH